MNRRSGIALVLLVLAFVLGLCPGASAGGDITGSYAVTGTNPGGGQYVGTAVVSKLGDAYQIAWVIGSNETYVGVGVLDGDILSVSYLSSGMSGVVSYRRTRDGFRGRWTVLGGDGRVHEEIFRRL